jgi:predicted small metal-binding protein
VKCTVQVGAGRSRSEQVSLRSKTTTSVNRTEGKAHYAHHDPARDANLEEVDPELKEHIEVAHRWLQKMRRHADRKAVVVKCTVQVGAGRSRSEQVSLRSKTHHDPARDANLEEVDPELKEHIEVAHRWLQKTWAPFVSKAVVVKCTVQVGAGRSRSEQVSLRSKTTTSVNRTVSP